MLLQSLAFVANFELGDISGLWNKDFALSSIVFVIVI